MNQKSSPGKTDLLADLLPPPYHLEAATWRDVGALQRLEKVCFPADAWPLVELLGVLMWPGVVRYKVTDGEGEMVGFAAGQEIEGAGWIVTIAVHPAHRRRGLGRVLLEACEAALPQPVLRLAVRASNRGAQALYREAGYAIVDRWPRYYVDGEDALVMEKRRGV